MMRSDGFSEYRCDKSTSLGVNTPNLAKILKCAGNEDVVTLKSVEDTDALSMTFESPSQGRVSEFELKLMDIDSEHLGIPDTEYSCTVRMPSAEFQRIIRDLSVLGDTCESSSFPSICLSILIFVNFNIRQYHLHQGGCPILRLRRPRNRVHLAEK
jgi:proliferating cell nuclear antigen